MFARTVKIEGRSIMVMCSPTTPLSEVLRRAANQLENEERAEKQQARDAYLRAMGAVR